MRDRNRAQFVVPLALAYAVMTVVGIVLSWQNGDLIDRLQQLPGVTGVAIIGSVLASRRPRNPIGWMFLSTSLSLAASNVCLGLAEYGAVTAPGSIPFAPVVAWLQLWFAASFFLLFVFSMLLFPTGRLPSPGWRPVAFGVALFGVTITATTAFGAASLPNVAGVAIPNPFFVPALAPAAVSPALVLLLLVVAVASLAARYRAGSTVEKQQLKWILLAAVLLAALAVVAGIPSPLSGAASLLALLVLPTAVAIAILRYQLYDIDHLINRTLVYGATSGLIAILFFAGLVALQPALRPLTEGSDLAVAASTLVAFALFQPIRRRVQDAVDRRFDRSRYDAARTLDAFTEDLRDEVDLDDLKADLIGAVRQTMSPAHVSLWLRERGR